MKQIPLLLFILHFSSTIMADPHYIQALHPFIGEKSSDQFLSLFNEPIEAHVDKYESLFDRDVFIYVYVFNELELAGFNLDQKCINIKRSDAIDIWDVSYGHSQDDESISWVLYPEKQKQVVWLYSPNEPIERAYKITNPQGKIIREGKIKAPSCIKTPRINTANLTDKQIAIFNGQEPYADLSDTKVTVDWVINADGNYVYDYTIDSNIKNKGEIDSFTIDIRCKWLSNQRHGYRPKSKSTNNKQHYQHGIADYRHDSTPGASNIYNHYVSWAPAVKPGETKGEFRIISMDPPISRNYRLNPSFDEGYLIPPGASYSDFEVTGMISAPGCHPDNDLNNPHLPENIVKRRAEGLKERKQREEERRKNYKTVMCVGAECLK